MKLSVALATKNEEDNIKRCLESLQAIASEIIIFDENSTDKTRDIAKRYGARVYIYEHKDNFHETKKAAMEKATGDWILQLDADEVVSRELRQEIEEVLKMGDTEILARRPRDKRTWELFLRHQRLVEERDGKFNDSSQEVVAFFLPRRNYFLGKPLIYAGVYPDAVIRLVKKGKAYLPAKSVHEQMVVKGRVAWLFSDLEHHDSPTLKRYLQRLTRYTDIRALEFSEKRVGKNIRTFFQYTFITPLVYFLKLYIRHKGYKDGVRGFLWSVFSAWHYPISYWKYWMGA